MPPVFTGKDDRGNSIGNNLTFWKAVKEGAKAPDGKPLWYKKGIEYWDAVAATDDGVLGGYGHVSTQDALDNTAFLEAVFGDALEAKKTGSRRLVACDCGAGIGRVTSSFLIHQFDEVDLVRGSRCGGQKRNVDARVVFVFNLGGGDCRMAGALYALEPVKHFINKAEELLGPTAPPRQNGHKCVNFFAQPLEGFHPEPGRYDVIWIQWCVGHLTDEDFVSFFQRCAEGLKPGGIIMVKENNAKEGFVLDTDDSSLTRSHKYFMHLFEGALGYKVVKHRLQKNFPTELFQVRMYAIKPTPPP